MSERRGSATISGPNLVNVIQILVGLLLYVWGVRESWPLDERLFVVWFLICLTVVGLFGFGYVWLNRKRSCVRR